MNLIVFDDEQRNRFYPLSLSRPISSFRLGNQTLLEKWEMISGIKPSYLVPEFLSTLYPLILEKDNYFINSRLVPNLEIWNQIQNLNSGELFFDQGRKLAGRFSNIEEFNSSNPRIRSLESSGSTYQWLDHIEDFIRLNSSEIISDFTNLKNRLPSNALSMSNRILGNQLWVGESVKAEFVNINTETGPVIIGDEVLIMEGAMLRGPLSIQKGSVIKMGAKIYGGTSIGPGCTVGGEIKNSILIGNSNKAHEGYLGDSHLGEWCNLGADTNNSNMKNNYKMVKIFDYSENGMRETNVQFLGTTMGDHVKCGINSTLNTGTVLGFGVNWFGPNLSPGFVPDFSWAESGTLVEYKLDKMLETAAKAMSRRNKILSEDEKNMIQEIFNITKPYRK